MTIRSRIGDFLFRVLFPRQAEVLRNAEVDAAHLAVVSIRSRAAVDDARKAIADTRLVLDATRDLVNRLTGPSV